MYKTLHILDFFKVVVMEQSHPLVDQDKISGLSGDITKIIVFR